MKHVLTQIQKKFGIREFPHAMFYEFEYALRFDLGGSKFGTNRPMRRFLHALERANAISQTLFETSSEIYLLLSSYGEAQPNKRRFEPFQNCGLAHSEFNYLGKTPQNDEDHKAEFNTDLFRHWDSARLNDKQVITEILWLCIAPEIGVRPCIDNSNAYLVDIDNGIALHVYDDRGMDIVSMGKEPMLEIFKEYREWLLNYDLDQMTATFRPEV